MSADLELAVRVALHYLTRASDDWRNANPRERGALHWPVAVWEAKRLLGSALGEPRETNAPDTAAGMAWWNALQAAERSYWLMCAESSVPAAAWKAFKAWEARP